VRGTEEAPTTSTLTNSAYSGEIDFMKLFWSYWKSRVSKEKKKLIIFWIDMNMLSTNFLSSTTCSSLSCFCIDFIYGSYTLWAITYIYVFHDWEWVLVLYLVTYRTLLIHTNEVLLLKKCEVSITILISFSIVLSIYMYWTFLFINLGLVQIKGCDWKRDNNGYIYLEWKRCSLLVSTCWRLIPNDPSDHFLSLPCFMSCLFSNSSNLSI